jgi:hypothetical protein
MDTEMATPKVVPNIGEWVMFVVLPRRYLPAVIVRVDSDAKANLVVFGDPGDGGEFARGTAVKMGVPQWDSKADGEHPPAGTWFRPVLAVSYEA